MSDRNQNHESHIPTNEEVIEEITREFKDQQINDETATNSQPPAATSRPDTPLDDPTPEDFNKSDSEDDSKSNILNDYVDEEQLKAINEGLSAEQKEERKQQASELKVKGNTAHKETKYLEAVESYTDALRLCPLENESDRAVLYCNRAASKIQLGYKETARDDCSKAIELNPNYVRAYLRRAKLYEETDKLDESLEDYKKVLEMDKGNPDALKATVRLPPLINERNEKLKTEMMGKLKDLGNMFLRPFGLSTENFQLQQDPNSGGYSVNFKQN